MLRKQRSAWDMQFVNSAPQALVKMQQGYFNVVITDLMMPEMNGTEFLEIVHQLFPETTRIVLSGHADESLTTKALKFAHQFLSKPIDADSLKQAIKRAVALHQIIQNQRIRAVIAGCDRLPSLPALYFQVQEAADSPKTNIGQIAQIIQQDMSMAAKILQIANSSFFGVRRNISSIEQGISLLGIMRLKALILSNHIFKQFIPQKRFEDFCVDNLWHHSYLVAQAAQMISKMEGQDEIHSNQSFAAGLMHDLGILIIASRQPDIFEQLWHIVLHENQSICEAEMKLLGATHTEIGSYLLGLWGVPSNIVEAVALHHSPNNIVYEGVSVVTTVHVAKALVLNELDPTHYIESESLKPDLDMNYLQRIGWDHRIDRWKQTIAQMCEETTVAVA